MKRNIFLAFFFIFISGTFGFCASDVNDESCLIDAEKLSSAFRVAVAKVMPAVVFVEVSLESSRGFLGDLQSGSGSGVIIDAKNGYVLTANHVVENAVRVVIKLADGRKFEAEEVMNDPKTEIAIVKISPENLPAAALGDSDKMQVGDWVLAIGSPLGEILANSVSAGIVSAKGRRTGILRQDEGYEDFIQTDAAINMGNSGGPLVNIRGEVIGINSNIVSSSGMSAGLGFAVPSNLAKRTIEDLVSKGKVERGYLGVIMANLSEAKQNYPDKITTADIERGGVYITETDIDGPAHKDGTLAGDIIIGIDGKKISSIEELRKAVGLARPEQKIQLSIVRQGKEINLTVKLGKHLDKQDAIKSKLATASESYKKLGVIASSINFRIWENGALKNISGLIIKFIKPSALAEEYGLEVGDIIVDVDGVKVSSEEEFEQAISKGNLQQGITVIVLDQTGTRRVILKSIQ
jgi:serine protease Do